MNEAQASDWLDEWAARLPGRRWHIAPNPTPHRMRKLDFVGVTESHGRQLHIMCGRTAEQVTRNLAAVVRSLSR